MDTIVHFYIYLTSNRNELYVVLSNKYYIALMSRSKMKPCKHGKMCKIKNCPLKHVAEEELEECQFYKQGFCCNGCKMANFSFSYYSLTTFFFLVGPKCARRHKKRMPEECPVEATFDAHINYSGTSVFGKKTKTAQPNDNFKVLCGFSSCFYSN